MTRGIASDLSGQIFGHLKVLERSGTDPQKNALWLCECSCGNRVSVRAAFLKKSQRFCSKQCPKYANENRVDISGQTFGKLTALEFVKVDRFQKAVWLCICECGNESEVSIGNLSNGHSESCGCGVFRFQETHGQSKTLEYHREARREWATRNPAKVIANAYKRTAALRERMPPWLTDEHWAQINKFYLEARTLAEETGIIHHVDHIHPLRGKFASGLHVPWNLQVLTREENLRKAARLIDDVC